MTAVYIFTLAAGLPLLLWFAFGGGETESGDVDGNGVLSVIPVSTVAFVLTFFGAAGLLGGWIGASALAALVLAVVVGVAAGALNNAAFGWLRRNSSSSDVTDRELEGTIAQVALPLTAGRRGRIILDVAGAREQMTASTVDGSDIEAGARVIVVGIEGGVALVTRLDPELDIQ